MLHQWRDYLVSLKIAIFLLNGAWNSCQQYLGLHAESIGVTLEELTIISSVLPIAACAGPPVSGLAADKLVNAKLVLIVSASVCAVSHLSLLAIDATTAVDGFMGSEHSVSMYDALVWRRWNFASYFALRLVGAFTLAGTASLLESVTITATKKHDTGIGKQRIFAVLSQGIFSFGSAAVLKWTTSPQGSMDYSYIFYLQAGLTFLALPFLALMGSDLEESGASFKISALLIFKQSHVILFTVMVFSFGACWGFHSTYYQLYLMDIQANSILLGLSVAVGCVIGVPLLFFADLLVKRFSPALIFAGSLLVYSVAFTGYALVRNPWIFLIFDSLVTHPLAGVAANYFSESVACPGTVATINGIINAILHGLGRSVGGAAGGSLVILFGYRISYAFFGLFALVMTLVYSAYNLSHVLCCKIRNSISAI